MKIFSNTLSILITLVILFLTVCSDNPTEPVNEPELIINIISGNYQHGSPGSRLLKPIVVRVNDKNNNPVVSVHVDFTIIAGAGSLTHSSSTTDSLGTASVQWTLGSGLDPMIKAQIEDENGIKTAAYAYANTDLEFMTRWTSDINIYANGTQLLLHDNRILESNSFLIFSSESSDDMKVLFAKIAEEDLEYLKSLFDISSSAELGINSSDINTKYKIYLDCDANCSPGNWSVAVNPALRFFALDSRLFNSLSIAQQLVRQILKHELTHVAQLLMIRPENIVAASTPVWFDEGIAEYTSGFTASCPAPIKTLNDLNAWINNSNHRNPLLINVWADFLTSEKPCEYYTMFGFIFKYLLDPNGLGKTCHDVKDMWLELSASHNFQQSFELHLGVSVDYLRGNLYTLLTNYLSQSNVREIELQNSKLLQPVTKLY